MGGNAERKSATSRGQTSDGAVMRSEEVARGIEEQRALGRQAHQPRRSLDQPVTEPVFQSLQLHADCALGGAERLSRAREALKIGNCHECLDGIHVQRGHLWHPSLLSLK